MPSSPPDRPRLANEATERGLGRGHPDIAGQRHGEPASRRHAVDGRDDGLGNPPEPQDQGGVALLDKPEEVFRVGEGGRILVNDGVVQVRTGAEAPAGPGNDQDPEGVVL